MNTEIQIKMQRLMYQLTKHAARDSYAEFLECLEISDDEYTEIKAIWKERLDVEPYI